MLKTKVARDRFIYKFIETSINVFNIKGQLVRNLLDKTMDEGTHTIEWNGKSDSGKTSSSGIYLIKLKTKSKSDIHKVMMLK